jgi:hypothetical protein
VKLMRIVWQENPSDMTRLDPRYLTKSGCTWKARLASAVLVTSFNLDHTVSILSLSPNSMRETRPSILLSVCSVRTHIPYISYWRAQPRHLYLAG